MQGFEEMMKVLSNTEWTVVLNDGPIYKYMPQCKQSITQSAHWLVGLLHRVDMSASIKK